MAWNKRKFEEHLEELLKAEFTEDKSSSMLAQYTLAREKLLNNIYDEIKAIEPHLSDHGSTHIANVLDNALLLIGSKEDVHKLSATDVYVLGMSILFHDVGNIYGRDEHHKKLGEIYDWVCGGDSSRLREKTLVLRIAGTHTGLASDGTKDTLKELSNGDHLEGKNVKSQEIASILRLADELAEGAQRTSEFLLDTDLTEPKSRIYHQYAKNTHIRIDRNMGRILLAYEIQLTSRDPREVKKELSEILPFTYNRIIKLDQERRYTRFYSDILLPFKTTKVGVNIHLNGNVTYLPELQLDDKVIPGDLVKDIDKLDTNYEVNNVVASVLNELMESEE